MLSKSGAGMVGMFFLGLTWIGTYDSIAESLLFFVFKNVLQFLAHVGMSIYIIPFFKLVVLS